MKTALIFPGQGSQNVGMGYDFYSNFQSSRDIYDQLDKIMGESLTNLIFKGVASELAMTVNSQPSIMATSVAIFSALKESGKMNENSFHCVAGHSLGEYSALVANKSLVFRDSVELLKIRSKAMQESMPIGTGGMAAIIGGTEEEIAAIINDLRSEGKVFIANDNAVGQVVISGEMKAIDYIAANSKKLGLKKVIKLSVSAPFHSELMMKASMTMENEIDKFSFKAFAVPLYSNVTSLPCDELEIKQILVEQIVKKVRWREIITNMINDGVEKFIEIGPGNVLTNLVKRMSKEVTSISISKVEDFEKLDNI
ncbi:ACP S-malonyltransferase [Pelagibacterales bacterium SAG-MED32]|nr:ACP S-malonyltransferase [Pelagibacterales bacterium SAG-MED32]